MHSVSANNDTRRAADATCSSSGITPGCVQTLYGVPTTLAKSSKNQLAVSGFIEQFAQQKDLTVRADSLRMDTILINDGYDV